MNFIISATTDIGNTKDTNQDSYNVRVFSTNIGRVVFAVLCDGMGGLSKGEVASASVVNAFCKWSETKMINLCEKGFTDYDIRTEWVNIANEYNEKIKIYGKKSGISLGTTVTVMMITQQKYYIMNIGDTRAYEISDNIRILTKDQTLVQNYVDQGLLTPDQADRDSRRSVLLYCIGASDVIYPDMYYGDVIQDAVYMLCTDGFRHEITQEEIYECLNPNVMLDADGMKERMKFLIDLNKQRQERDNISVITIRTF